MAEYIDREALLLRVDCQGTNKFGMLDEDIRAFIKSQPAADVLPKDMADEIALKLMRLADLENICSYARLRELAEADKEGRVVVLPCKVGDKLYRVLDGNISEHEVQNMKYFARQGRLGIDMTPFFPDAERFIGKTVFLTREEAEKGETNADLHGSGERAE